MDLNPRNVAEHGGVIIGIGWAWVAAVPWAQVAAFCAVCYYMVLGYEYLRKKVAAKRQLARRSSDK